MTVSTTLRRRHRSIIIRIIGSALYSIKTSRIVVDLRVVTAIVMQVEVSEAVTGCTVTGTAEAAHEMSGCVTLRTNAQGAVQRRGHRINMAVVAGVGCVNSIPDRRAVGRNMTVVTILSWPG